jgi:hypothetical protein
MAIQFTLGNTNYLDVLKAFIKAVEGAETDPYVDTQGYPTIGWGFILVSSKAKPATFDHLIGSVLGVNPARAGLSSTPATPASGSQPATPASGAAIRERYYFDRLKSVASQTYTPENSANHTGTSTLALRTALNQVLVDRANEINSPSSQYTAQDQALIGTPPLSFRYTNPNDMATTFERIKSSYDTSVNNNFGTPPESLERVALFSMVYQGQVSTLQGSPAHYAFAQSIRDAMNSPDNAVARAEAWYAIRYGQRPLAVASRAYMEAALFGLYNDPSNITASDAQAVYRMFNLHRSSILVYDRTNAVALTGAKSTLQNSGTLSAIAQVSTISEALDLAKTALLTDLRNSNPDLANKLQDDQWVSTNIYVAKTPSVVSSVGDTLDSLAYQTGNFQTNGAEDLMVGDVGNDTLKGNKGNDLLIGNGGKDVLEGGDGDDTLAGGAGIDRLLGGAGTDTYVFRAGDGEDTIEDSDGLGAIKVAGTTLVGAAQTEYLMNGQWSVNSGEIVYTLDETNKRLVISGTALGADNSITINKVDVAKLTGTDGYLGIKLDRTFMTALVQGSGTNVFGVSGFNPSSLAGQQSNITEGCGKTFTICLNQPAKANETITLALDQPGGAVQGHPGRQRGGGGWRGHHAGRRSNPSVLCSGARRRRDR